MRDAALLQNDNTSLIYIRIRCRELTSGRPDYLLGDLVVGSMTVF
jgi:hypothetical protein